MTYGVIVTIAAPISAYDALHRELLRQTGGTIEGLLVHVGRETANGFEVIEVWESKTHYDDGNREVLWPLAAKVLGEQLAGAAPALEEFEVRGLVMPGRQMAV